MKKIIIALTIIASSILATSCKSGCGCPGGAGYGYAPADTQIEATV